MPITPPPAAQARSTSSGFIRGVGHTDRAPACVMNTGLLDTSKVSRQVRSLEWETSIARPSLFIRSTARRPKTVSPPSPGSFSPLPSVLDSEYAMPICRTPEAVEDVEPVDLVLDRGRRLQAEHEREAAAVVRRA